MDRRNVILNDNSSKKIVYVDTIFLLELTDELRSFNNVYVWVV